MGKGSEENQMENISALSHNRKRGSRKGLDEDIGTNKRENLMIDTPKEDDYIVTVELCNGRSRGPKGIGFDSVLKLLRKFMLIW